MRQMSPISILTIAVSIACCGCHDHHHGKPAPDKTNAAIEPGKPVHILCSFFPIYVFTRNVVGDAKDVTVSLMVPAQTGCPHEYDLTPSDRKKIADANIFVMNGGGLEEFTEKQVSTANPNVRIVDASAKVAKLTDDDNHDHSHGHKDGEHEHKAGDQKEKANHNHDHDGRDHAEKSSKAKKDDHDHDDHDHAKHAKKDDHADHHHHGGANPHFFSSPHQASLQVDAIAEALAKLDPARATAYAKNGKEYAAKLRALDEEFHKKAASFKRKKIVTMHEVFDYLAHDLHLEVVGTIKSSPGQDPSTNAMAKLVRELKEKKPAAIFTEPQYSEKVAETLSRDTGVPVEKLDPVASGPENPPADYYETAMRKNLETLVRVLGTATQASK